jgi:DNA transformation protein and related proteins
VTDAPIVPNGEEHSFGERLPLEQMLNIGPVTAGWLHEVGIHTREDLEETGPIEAWRLLKELHPGAVSLVGLYALQGAILGVHWNHLPPDLKAQLRRAARI